MNLTQWASLGLLLFAAIVIVVVYSGMSRYRHLMLFSEHVLTRFKILGMAILAVVQAYTLITDTSAPLVLLKAGTFVSIFTGLLWRKTLDDRYKLK